MLSEDDTVFEVIYLVIIILLMIYAIAGAFFEHKNFHLLHETGLGILIGAFVGGIAYFAFDKHYGFEFGEILFFYGLLPPIIFEAGYNLKKNKIFENLSYIGIFGILGTVVAFFVIMGLTFAVEAAGWIINSKDGRTFSLGTTLTLLFSATICATDSVAALTMIKPKKYPKLFSIVFGEGMVNDAVAIILFNSVLKIFGNSSITPEITADTIINIIINFITILIVSFLIGLSSGLICTLMFKHWRFLADNVIAQIVLTFLFGSASYAICQLLHYSGVISVLVCGVTMAHFNFYNLSLTGQLSTQITFKFLSFASQSFLFIYLGLASWNYSAGNFALSWTFIVLELVICAIGRFCSVFVVSGLFYLVMKKKWKVNFYELGIIWFAGVIRGSVAFALILTVPVYYGYQQQVQIIKSTVLVIVLVTTVFLGAIMPYFTKCSLSHSQKSQQQKTLSLQSIIQQQPQNQLPIQSPLLPPQPSPPSKFKQIDQTIFKPFFIYNYLQRKDQIQYMKKRIKLSSGQFQISQLLKQIQQIQSAKYKQSLLISNKDDNSLLIDEAQ